MKDFHQATLSQFCLTFETNPIQDGQLTLEITKRAIILTKKFTDVFLIFDVVVESSCYLK